jgi:hypothetical protein
VYISTPGFLGSLLGLVPEILLSVGSFAELHLPGESLLIRGARLELFLTAWPAAFEVRLRP